MRYQELVGVVADLLNGRSIENARTERYVEGSKSNVSHGSI